MKNMKRYTGLILAGCFILCTATALSAQDWPQWRGMNRDGKVTGFKTPEKWPAALTKKWTVTVGTGDSTPALVGTKLYVFTRNGDDEVVRCLDAENGKELWQYKYPARAVTGPAAKHPGPRSSPTVTQGKVVTLGVGGILSCIDAATGKVLWVNDQYTNEVPDFFTAMSPVAVDGMCISHLGGKNKGTLLALDLATGREKWKLDCDGPAYGSPVLMTVEGTKQIVLLSEKNMFGVATANGRLLWQIPAPNERMFFSCATPVIEEDKVFYTGQGHGTKAVRIEKKGDDFTAGELWSNDELGTTFNTPVLEENLLFGISKLGYVFCISAQSGETRWIDNRKLDRFGSIVDTGRFLMGLSANSELIVFKPDNKAFTELARYRVAETPTLAHPVVSGNRIYVKDAEMLTMWEIE